MNRGYIEGPNGCNVELLDTVNVTHTIYVVCCFDNNQIYFYPIGQKSFFN